MCTCLTFLSRDVQRGDHTSHRCAHSAHLKAHHEPLCTLCATSMTNSNIAVSNVHAGNSRFTNVPFCKYPLYRWEPVPGMLGTLLGAGRLAVYPGMYMVAYTQGCIPTIHREVHTHLGRLPLFSPWENGPSMRLMAPSLWENGPSMRLRVPPSPWENGPSMRLRVLHTMGERA